MTTSLSSSLDVLSLTSSSSRWASDSPSDEDEIVWSLSSSALLSTSPPLHSPLSETTDFVLVPRAAAVPLTTADTIADEMAALSLTPAPHARGNADPSAPPSAASPKRTSTKGGSAKKTKSVPSEQHSTTAASQQQQQQPRRQQAPTAPPAAPRKKGNRRTRKPRGSSPGSASSASSTAAAHVTPSARPSRISSAETRKSPAKSGAACCAAPATTGLAVVDDSVSEASDASSSPSPAATGYQEAHKYMTSYLAHPPPPGNNGSALLMLQALILELGCLPGVAAGKFSIPQLPATMRQAKLLLKSHAFINVRDYLAVREQGQAALQRAMHPSRTSLVKEVRKGKRMPVGEVKKAGLNVLLVHTRS